jgi:butyryl-CoA dehydrogenase
MRFELTEDQKMIQQMVREFAEKEVAPLAAQIDAEARYPEETIKKMAELNLMGMMVPEKYGGAGVDTVSYALAMEEIAKACASTSTIMSVNNSLVCDPLLKNGTEEQKQKYLVPLAKGKLLGCFGLSEPNAGSDAANQQTAAVLKGDKWTLNGRKNFTTNGAHADICILFASTDKAQGHKGISAFIVELDTPGFSIGKIEKKLGICGSDTASLVFEDCQIPKENLLGEVGRGFKIAMETLDGGRIGIAAQAVGIAQAALEQSTKYSKERVQFRQTISNFQAIQWMLADMATEIECARLLTLKAATLKDKGIRHSSESSMAKLFASETAMRATHKAIQIHGGYGYIKDYPVERYFRDARITEIYEGTSEIQRLVIAAHLLK